MNFDHLIHNYDNHLVKLWTLQLYKEYDQILYTYDIKLTRPTIKLSHISTFYGMWCSKTRTITLAINLIKKHCWSDTLEVLKHEIAHQYVDEILGSDDNHGPKFKEACHILRIASWAQKACLQLSEKLIEKKKSDKKEDLKLLRWIEKLKQLANSSNKNEALEALKKAKYLSEKYQLQLEPTWTHFKICSELINHKKKKIEPYQSLIVNILTSFFKVQIIYSSLYDPMHLCNFKTIEIYGIEHNVKIAEYIYWFLDNTLKILWKNYMKKESVSGLKAKNQFFDGVLSGLYKQIDKSTNNKETKKENQLLVLQDQETKNFIQFKYPKISYRTKKHAITSNQHFTDGHQIGLKLSISKGLKYNDHKKNKFYIE